MERFPNTSSFICYSNRTFYILGIFDDRWCLGHLNISYFKFVMDSSAVAKGTMLFILRNLL